MGEDVHVRTLCPVDVGGRVNCFLDVVAIEVQRGQLNLLERTAVKPRISGWLNSTSSNWHSSRESENIPQNGEGVEDAVNVEGWILIATPK